MVFIPATGSFRFRRSVLFMPASNERALIKASALDCDCLIFDLEDAVAGEERGGALANLKKHVKDTGFERQETVIRVNAVDSREFAADLAIAAECGIDAVLLPKVETAKAVNIAETHLKAAGSKAALWAMIETPMALMNLADIARKNSRAFKGRLECLVVGPNDLAKATGVSLSQGRTAMQPWLMQVVATARAYGMSALDGVYNNFRDLDGLAAECAEGAIMGFDGKTLIHPAQIEAANLAFSPSGEELQKAHRIVEAFDRAENKNRGAIQIDGEMVERLHLSAAMVLLALFD